MLSSRDLDQRRHRRFALPIGERATRRKGAAHERIESRVDGRPVTIS